MSSLGAAALRIVAVIVALLVGQFLYLRYYSESRGIESAFRMVLNTFLIITGIAMILGGYYLTGMIFLSLGWYFWNSNRRRVHESDIATDTTRSWLANIWPSNGRRR